MTPISAIASQSTPKPLASCRIATGCASSNCRAGDGTADVVQIAAGQARAPNIERLLADPQRHEIVSFRPVRHRGPVQCLWRHGGADLLHQDRFQTRPDLYRPARLEGSDARAARPRNIEAAAIVGLGQRHTLSEAQLAYAASDVLHLHALARPARRNAEA